MTESPTRLYLMRHAEVESKYHQVFGGRIDMDLSPKGRDQAQALADYLNTHPLDTLAASPMKRARQTVAPLAHATGLDPVFMEGLREVDFGDWTGFSWHEVQSRFNLSPFDWLDLLDRAAIPNAEATHAWTQRVRECLDFILTEFAGRKVGVLCHGGTIRVLLSLLLDLPLVRTAAFEIEYASITRVECQPGRARIHMLNMTPWRDVP